MTEEEEILSKLEEVRIIGEGPLATQSHDQLGDSQCHQMDANDTVLYISFQLPVKVSRIGNGQWEITTDGSSVLSAMHEYREKRRVRIMFFGWPGIYVARGEQESLARELLKVDCIPVYPPEAEFEEFLSFCNRFLWPVFHDVLLFFQSANPPAFPEKQWLAYQRINQVYAESVISHSHETDLFWVHDFHLLLFPQFMTRKIRRANIGLYLHVAFPSHEIFKCLPVREEMLRGMLCADLIGFQFYRGAGKFFVSCRRLLGLEPEFYPGGFYGLDYSGRRVSVLVSHCCSPHQEIAERSRLPDVLLKDKDIRGRYPGRKIFAGYDAFQSLAGLMLKVRAFVQFLKDCPEMRGKVVLIQYANRAFVHHEDDEKNEQELMELVDQANAMYPEKHIEFVIGKILRDDRLSLFRAADVLWDMSLGNGMNLNPFEYCCCQREAQRDGVIIVSDFSGCAHLLQGVITINPWNTVQVVEACKRACTMSKPDRQKAQYQNHNIATRRSQSEWIAFFVDELFRARKKDDTFFVACGFGANYRLIGLDQSFQRLECADVLRAYRASRNRVFFIDYDGTLVPDLRKLHRFYGAPRGVEDLTLQGQAPGDTLVECLQHLCKDTKNTVVIVSGRDQRTLESLFSRLPEVGLVSEHGFHYRVPSLGRKDQWHSLIQQADYTWKSITFEIMTQYAKRTQGSYIENKGSALVWVFRNADPDFGAWQAKELSQTLTDILFGFPVEVVSAKGFVDVRLEGVSKGCAVSKILSKIQSLRGDVDFAICIGDDRTDEDMFDVINALGTGKDDDVLSTTDCGEGYDGGSSDCTNSSQSILKPNQPRMRLPPQMTNMLQSKSANVLDQVGRTTRDKTGASGSRLGPTTNTVPGCRGSFSNLSGLCDSGTATSHVRRFITCTVGRKPTHARYYLDDVEDVNDLMIAFKLSGKKRFPWSNADTMPGGLRVYSKPPVDSIFFEEASQ